MFNQLANYLILIPLISAGLLFLFGRINKLVRDLVAVLSSLATAAVSFSLWPQVLQGPINFGWGIDIFGLELGVGMDVLALSVITLISGLGFLATLYSVGYMKEHSLSYYYTLMLLFIGSMNGAVMGGDLLTMFLFWEFMTIFAFFLVIYENSQDAIKAGKKYFIMSETGALLMLISIMAILYFSGHLHMGLLSLTKLNFGATVNTWLLIPFLLGMGVKAGMLPVHSWLPDAHPAAPSPVSALLSGIMIKVGIYLMVRIFWQIFIPTLTWQTILCALGSLTILFGVFAAMMQHDSKRLLAYHSVSQIGYMVLGIGTGTALGVAGGVFHLINHALFKGLLFLCVGCVILRLNTRELGKMGGLLKPMPITFITCLIASLSISGVPPFNGFFSKWMVYQAVIQSGNPLWVLWLTAAVFGSALTLASFVKLMHAIFFAKPAQPSVAVKEVPWTMTLPLLVLAILCTVFGIFAVPIPLKYMVFPIVGQVTFSGLWSSELATGMIILGLLLGLLIYVLSNLKKTRVSPSFIGGEELSEEEQRSPGTDFYNTIRNWGWLRALYNLAETEWFEIYNVSHRATFGVAAIFKKLHNGLLPAYIAWCFIGLAVLLFVLVR